MLDKLYDVVRRVKEKMEASSIEGLLLLSTSGDVVRRVIDIADNVNRRINGNDVSYVNGVQIYYTNICRSRCKICSFYKAKKDKGSYVFDPEQIAGMIPSHAKQVTLSGGLNPALPLKYYHKLLGAIKRKNPDIVIEGFSPSEIHFFCRRFKRKPKEVLKKFKECGLDVLSGDSANILSEKVRKKISQDKMKVRDWFEIIRTAHKLKIPTTASIVVGHIEKIAHIGEHLDHVATIQRETGMFTYFKISAFVPEGTALARERGINQPVSLKKLIKVSAVSRLFMKRLFRVIQVDWPKIGVDNTMEMLKAGASDIGLLNVSPAEVRTQGLQLTAGGMLPENFIKQKISAAGKTLVERHPIIHPETEIPQFADEPSREEAGVSYLY